MIDLFEFWLQFLLITFKYRRNVDLITHWSSPGNTIKIQELLTISVNYTLQILRINKVLKSHVKSSQADLMYSSLLPVLIRSVRMLPPFLFISLSLSLNYELLRNIAEGRTSTSSKHISRDPYLLLACDISAGHAENTACSTVACWLAAAEMCLPQRCPATIALRLGTSRRKHRLLSCCVYSCFQICVAQQFLHRVNTSHYLLFYFLLMSRVPQRSNFDQLNVNRKTFLCRRVMKCRRILIGKLSFYSSRIVNIHQEIGSSAVIQQQSMRWFLFLLKLSILNSQYIRTTSKPEETVMER
jgi:hypothetical protein